MNTNIQFSGGVIIDKIPHKVRPSLEIREIERNNQKIAEQLEREGIDVVMFTQHVDKEIITVLATGSDAKNLRELEDGKNELNGRALDRFNTLITKTPDEVHAMIKDEEELEVVEQMRNLIYKATKNLELDFKLEMMKNSIIQKKEIIYLKAMLGITDLSIETLSSLPKEVKEYLPKELQDEVRKANWG